MIHHLLTFTEESLAAALGRVGGIHELSVELMAEDVFAQAAPQADHIPESTKMVEQAVQPPESARPTGLSRGWNLVRQHDGFVIGHSSIEPTQNRKEQALEDGRVYVPFLVPTDVAALVEALKQAKEWLEGWASAEPQLAIINAALATYHATQAQEGDA